MISTKLITLTGSEIPPSVLKNPQETREVRLALTELTFTRKITVS